MQFSWLEESGLGFVSDGARRMFPPRLRRGTRHPDAPLSPCFAAEERPCDTLRALGGKRGALPTCPPGSSAHLWFRGSWNPAGSLGCAVVPCARPVPSELGRGKAVAF